MHFSSTQYQNRYSWDALFNSRGIQLSFVTVTDPAMWELRVYATDNYHDRSEERRNRIVANIFQSCPLSIRKSLGLKSIHTGYVVFNDPAKFPLVELILAEIADNFESIAGWRNSYKAHEWAYLLNQAESKTINSAVYIFSPPAGSKRPKAPPRIDPEFEEVSPHGAHTVFRWIPRKSRRRMAEAWIKIERRKREDYQEAFVTLGFDCENDMGIQQPWSHTQFFCIPLNERGAKRLGKCASTKITTTFQGSESEITLLIDSMRRLAEHAKEKGILAGDVDRPLDEFIAMVEADELANLIPEQPTSPPTEKKVKRRGVL